MGFLILHDMNEGWIKLHRSFLEWEWYDDYKTKIVFIDLLLRANHENKTWRGVFIKRGQVFTSVASISANTRLSSKAVRTCLSKLKRTGEVTIETASNGTMITICNYDTYQELENQKGKRSGNQYGKRGANEGQTKGNKQEYKNEKNEKKNIIDDMLSSAYKLSVDFWLKEFHVGWDFGSVHGKNLKTLLMKLKKSMEDSGREITSQTICDTFKAMCINLPDWFKDKDLPVLASKYNEIIQQIKDGKNRKPKGGADPTLTVESVWS